MKLKSGVIITEAQGGYVAVDAGGAKGRFNGMIKMNATAAFIANELKGGADEDALVCKMLEKYDVSESEARESVKDVLNKFAAAGLTEDE